MKIHENVHVKGIFHDDKSNNESLYTHIRVFPTGRDVGGVPTHQPMGGVPPSPPLPTK